MVVMVRRRQLRAAPDGLRRELGGRQRRAARQPNRIGHVGRVAQWESARFTRERPLVQSQPCPLKYLLIGSF